MTTLSERFPEIFPPERPVVDHDSDWFARAWLHELRRRTARTEPVIAVVRELATTMRDEQIPAPQAHRVLRRAVSLLTVLAGSSPAASRQVDRGNADHDDEAQRYRYLAREAVFRPGESTGFAKAWLHGSPAEAIRTEPVIAIVEQLLDDLITEKPTVAYASLRQAVQVLSVFAREDDSTVGEARPANSTIE
jgi:hypothetical protein